MKCPVCDAELVANAPFCTNCGARVNRTPNTGPTVALPAADTGERKDQPVDAANTPPLPPAMPPRPAAEPSPFGLPVADRDAAPPSSPVGVPAADREAAPPPSSPFGLPAADRDVAPPSSPFGVPAADRDAAPPSSPFGVPAAAREPAPPSSPFGVPPTYQAPPLPGALPPTNLGPLNAPPPPTGPYIPQGTVPPGTYAPTGPQSSTSAIISLVFGILSYVFLPVIGPLVAVVAGHMARSEIRRSGGQVTGDGLAIAGLILGYIQLIGLVLICLFVFVLGAFGVTGR